VYLTIQLECIVFCKHPLHHLTYETDSGTAQLQGCTSSAPCTTSLWLDVTSLISSREP